MRSDMMRNPLRETEPANQIHIDSHLFMPDILVLSTLFFQV